jgi:hypothetical protein
VRLARRLGLDLAGRNVAVVAMGGATSIRHFLGRYPATVRVCGVCDERDAHAYLRAGVPAEHCFVCRADLEDELIRAVGTDAVEQVIAAAGEEPTWRRMRSQPAQRGRPVEAQLRRFMGTRSGRKERYAALLVDALDLSRAPAPLAAALQFAAERSP